MRVQVWCSTRAYHRVLRELRMLILRGVLRSVRVFALLIPTFPCASSRIDEPPHMTPATGYCVKDCCPAPSRSLELERPRQIHSAAAESLLAQLPKPVHIVRVLEARSPGLRKHHGHGAAQHEPRVALVPESPPRWHSLVGRWAPLAPILATPPNPSKPNRVCCAGACYKAYINLKVGGLDARMLGPPSLVLA